MTKGQKFFFIFITLVSFGCYRPCFAQNVDVDILKSINPEHPTSLYWRYTSNSAYYAAGLPFATMLYGFIENDATAKRNGVELFINVGASTLITEIMKRGFNCTRPADKYPDDVFSNTVTHGHSFPSGHTSLAFSTATTVSLQYKKWYITVPAYVWASSVGYSRMYLGKHYPSDVLAGAAVGIGTAYAGHWLNQKLFKKSTSIHTYHE